MNEKKCMYCEHCDLITDSDNDLRWICTKVESRDFLTEIDFDDSCEEFETERNEEEDWDLDEEN